MLVPKPGTFSSCENIANFYRQFTIPAQETTGLLGGKYYAWYIEHSKNPFLVTCRCNVNSLGLGVLKIQSKLAGTSPDIAVYYGPANVDRKGKVTAGFLAKHTIQLPLPEAQQTKFPVCRKA